MHAAMALPGNAQTILTHLFGRGLEDDRYVVERFQAMADGDIRRLAQSLRSLRPHHSRTPPGHSFRPRWLPCARVNQ